MENQEELKESTAEEVKVITIKKSEARHKENDFKVVKFLKTNDTQFIKACELAGVQPTKRQASKWLSHKGAAWKFGR